ncbi:SAM-dependent methyltransferase [Streptomonospora litoralis]|uniref:S-adenosyl methyltransferase n=1 Tax=Streptomonospora litoralis TaxID=2498135 RepID=A0A4P6Q792_9ACTN|nr:SAM-dependent methyltransferase [Streptomonospora litoralis]QBI54969.1 S-adenosyl methyltransferase [Streptomonospora litoralis]
MDSTSETGPAPAGVDTTVAHSARVWNYWLGGKDNYAADREVGDYVFAAYPEIVEAARADRAFLIRAVTHLAREEGIRQFLDIGTGLPTRDNTHQVAQEVAPESRIVYVDNDPLVLSHARALLVGTPEGATDYVDADLRDPQAVLQRAAALLDLSRPVALTVLGTMGHIADTGEAHELVARYMNALPSGSFLALCDGSSTSPEMVEAAERWNATAALPYHLRSPEEFAGFFTGLHLLDPGVVSATRWRPDETADAARDADQYCGVARKP